MAKDNKFGTFGGVFTPSILTILGVIMYLRLPMVVGNAGLMGAIGIIVVAHVVSLTTGWSVASIATDKAVGAGGPYYIISRSLGLPIGGTIGLGLFVGLSFSISLYVIGFSESFLTYWGWEATPTNIRLCGTITVILLTALTLISTALAIKTQYLILVLIALSLVSIFFGKVPEGLDPAAPLEGGESMVLLFGIFFPAVTGFTAGVNMSGDLRDPKKSIPYGTLAAIGVGFVVYIALAAFLYTAVPPELLAGDPEVLLTIAAVPAAVVAGIWGATLSSALGSILGAPRILQALSVDRITPRFFGKGAGPSNEPRRALLLAFGLAEAGILIAELNAIAEIVSMVFLMMYGVVNLSAAVESWVSPDFRPEFRVPKVVSITGAVTCALLMVYLNLPAMLAATAVMVGLFIWLQRRQLRLDSGDAWEGVWSSLVRAGLHRLAQDTAQQRNWRPNILYFSPRESELRAPTLEFSSALISGRGIITDFEFVKNEQQAKAAEPEEGDEELQVGIFRRPIVSQDVFETISGVCEYHGVSGLKPNTVLLDWATYAHEPKRMAELLQRLKRLDLNTLLYARDPKRELGGRRAIDVWWRADAGNLALSVSLLRFVTTASDWRDVSIRLLIVTEDASSTDVLQASARRYLQESRIEVQLRVIHNVLGVKEYEDWIREESTDADLTIVGLPNQEQEIDEALLAKADTLQRDIGTVMFVGGSSSFPEVLRVARAGTAAHSIVGGDTFELELEPLELPTAPELASAASTFSRAQQKTFSEFHEHCIARVYALHNDLLRRVRESVERHLAMLEKGMVGADPRRKRKAVNRVQSAFVQDSKRRVAELEKELIPEVEAILEQRIETFLSDKSAVDETAKRVRVHRDAEAFKSLPEDPGAVRRFKRRRRTVAFLTRSEPSYEVPLAELQGYYTDRGVREQLRSSARQLVAETHQLAIHIGKTMNRSRTSLAMLGDSVSSEELPEFLAERRQEALDEFDGLIEMNEQRVEQHRRALLSAARSLSQELANDLDRVDVVRLVRRERRTDPAHEGIVEELRAVAGAWHENQELLLERAKAGLVISELQHRLASLAHRIRANIALEIRNGTLSEYETLHKALVELSEGLADGKPEQLKFGFSPPERFDPVPIVHHLMTEFASWAGDLPERVHTLTDESISVLEEGSSEDTQVLELAVRPLVEFVFETEFVAGLQEELTRIPPLEQRAIGVAQDVVRLISFNLGEYESLTETGEQVDFGVHMGPVVKNGLERLEPELEQLAEIAPRVTELIEKRLDAVIEKTNPYELEGASAELGGLRLEQGKRAVSGVGLLFRTGVDKVRGGFVKLLYRRSAGLLLARRLRAGGADGRVPDRVAALVAQSSPKAEVLSALPYYYRQLFFGQSTVNEAFWVGREPELARTRHAVANFRRGGHGAIIVVGERNSGKTALCQRIVTRQLASQTVHRIPAPAGGSIDPAAFRRAFEAVVGVRGPWDTIFGAMHDNTVIVINDVELWWERSADGLAVIEELMHLIDEHGKRCLFLLDLSTPAFDFINRLCDFGDKALAVIECGPLPAEALKEIVTLRHGSTGLSFEFDEKTEDKLAPWTLARLFTSHFDHARGNVGAALRSWASHIDRIVDDTLVVRVPQVKGWDALDDLRVEWVALLLQLILHKQLTMERLSRVTKLDPIELRAQIDTLHRMGLVTRNRQNVVGINRFVEHILLDRFERRGLLP